MPGSLPDSLKSTSTTAPMTWTMVPWLLILLVFGERLAERDLRGGDFENFGGDGGLADLVVFEGQVLDELLGVVGRILHRDHPRAVLGGAAVVEHLINLEV